MSEPTQAVAVKQPVSLVAAMAAEYGLEEVKFAAIIRATVMPTKDGQQIASNEMLAAFLQVAHTYKLNPFIKEIYAFPSKGGGIQPIVSIDGWLTIANRDPRFEGYDYEEIRENGKLEGGQITVYIKDRQRPVVHREWFA